MARTYTTLVLALVVLFNTHDMQVSAQMGTVQNALFDYIRMNSGQQATTNTQAQPTQPPQTAPANTGTDSMFNMFPQNTAPATNTGTATGGSFMDLFAAAGNPTSPMQNAQPAASNPGPTQAPAASQGTNPMAFYNQLMSVVNPSQGQGQGLGQTTLQTPQPGTPPFANPFTNSPQPNTAPAPAPTQTQTNQVQQQTQAPRVLPFVPPQWNLAPTANQAAQSAANSGTTGWGHQTHHQGPTAWEQYYNPNHRRAPQPTRSPPSPQHPMSRMMMIPRVRTMINQQATQFGDMAYYTQHGCVDPTPAVAPAGGIRPTQTLWYGCQSPVSKMVCMRVGRTAAGPGNSMAMIMSMMNPSMARTFEKCLAPKMLTNMMMQGFSGGAGGMNPSMMMMMNGGGGGGGGMAGMMPMLMMMMNRQNQARGNMGGMGGMRGNMGGMGGMGGNMGGNTGGSMSGGQATAPAATGSPLSAANPNKGVFKDPNTANTLISQAAKIPMGAAQPLQQTPANPFAASGGMGGNQAGSNLPVGAASGGMGSMGGMGGMGGGQAQPVDCSAVIPLVMSRVMAAGEGFAGPEAQEAITELRKQYLPYSCQELRLKYTGMPLRMCCPGKVDPPTMMDLFSAKGAGAA